MQTAVQAGALRPLLSSAAQLSCSAQAEDLPLRALQLVQLDAERRKLAVQNHGRDDHEREQDPHQALQQGHQPVRRLGFLQTAQNKTVVQISRSVATGGDCAQRTRRRGADTAGAADTAPGVALRTEATVLPSLTAPATEAVGKGAAVPVGLPGVAAIGVAVTVPVAADAAGAATDAVVARASVLLLPLPSTHAPQRLANVAPADSSMDEVLAVGPLASAPELSPALSAGADCVDVAARPRPPADADGNTGDGARIVCDPADDDNAAACTVLEDAVVWSSASSSSSSSESDVASPASSPARPAALAGADSFAGADAADATKKRGQGQRQAKRPTPVCVCLCARAARTAEDALADPATAADHGGDAALRRPAAGPVDRVLPAVRVDRRALTVDVPLVDPRPVGARQEHVARVARRALGVAPGPARVRQGDQVLGRVVADQERALVLVDLLDRARGRRHFDGSAGALVLAETGNRAGTRRERGGEQGGGRKGQGQGGQRGRAGSRKGLDVRFRIVKAVQHLELGLELVLLLRQVADALENGACLHNGVRGAREGRRRSKGDGDGLE